MAQSDLWSLAQLRTLARNELADPSAASQKWGDAELNSYIVDWQDICQNTYEFCWSITTATLSQGGGGAQWNFFEWNGTSFNASGSSTNLSTITLANVSPNMMRPAEVYYLLTSSGVASRLVPRNKTDLELMQRDWRGAPGVGIPTVVYQDDPTVLNLWPPPTTAGTIVIEHPINLTLSSDTSTMQIPAFCRYSARHYVGYRAHLRFSAMQNLGKAAVYKKLWDNDLRKMSATYQAFQPYRAEMLRPGGKWNADILNPRSTILGRV